MNKSTIQLECDDIYCIENPLILKGNYIIIKEILGKTICYKKIELKHNNSRDFIDKQIIVDLIIKKHLRKVILPDEQAKVLLL
jgi:hypothetical protein